MTRRSQTKRLSPPPPPPYPRPLPQPPPLCPRLTSKSLSLLCVYDGLLAPKRERKYLAFDSSQPSGGKILLFFFLILVSHEPMSQKEKSSTQLDIFSIFSSTQRKCVKREMINNYLLLSQVHGLPAPKNQITTDL